ncbi:hypothetical protein V6N11_040394 [Hibiscus sabdariffa]|uniref:Uncharacterized protein n=1 Tax=Hibiscus sabdariffa TaxID=183260 RepID=A0ABR2RHZ1_9ROSI
MAKSIYHQSVTLKTWLVGRWGESLDDFSENDENIVPITEDDEFELLDADDVNILRTAAVKGNDLDMEDDVWATAVARLGLVEDPIVWGFVQTEPIVEDVWANAVARMKLVDEPVAWGYVQPGPNQRGRGHWMQVASALCRPVAPSADCGWRRLYATRCSVTEPAAVQLDRVQ